MRFRNEGRAAAGDFTKKDLEELPKAVKTAESRNTGSLQAAGIPGVGLRKTGLKEKTPGRPDNTLKKSNF